MEWRVVGQVGEHHVDVVITPPIVSSSSRSGGTKVSSQSNEQVSEEVARIRSSLPSNIVGLADQMAVVFAESNKSGQVSSSRLLRELWIPLAAAVEKFPALALAHGLEVAVAKGVPNLNYAKKAAEGFDASPTPPTTTIRRRVLGGEHG